MVQRDDPEIDEMIQETYTSLTEIAKGGFGSVFKGVNLLMKEEHAIKIQDIDNSKEREIEMLVKFRHETILPVIYAYRTKTQMISFHPFYESNLKEILENPISMCMKVKLFQGILNGVQYLHSNHAIHLDLKPANILVNTNRECILADFGLTKLKDNTVITVSTRMATPGYASPERNNMSLRSDYSDDVWALVCILYELFENGNKANSTYLSQDDDSCTKQGSLPFYKDILLPGFKKRQERITLVTMMIEFKRIALELLHSTPDSQEKETTIQWLKAQDIMMKTAGNFPMVQEHDSENSEDVPCKVNECLLCQDPICSNCIDVHLIEHDEEEVKELGENEVEVSFIEEVKGEITNIKNTKEISLQVSIDMGNNEQTGSQTDPISLVAHLALPMQFSNKVLKIIIPIIAIISLIIIASLVWYIFSLKADNSNLNTENDELKMEIELKVTDYEKLLNEFNEIKITNSNLYQQLNTSYLSLQEENTQQKNELKKFSERYEELEGNNTQLQRNFDKLENEFKTLQNVHQKFLKEASESVIIKEQEKRIRAQIDMIDHEALIRYSGVMLTTQGNTYIDKFNSLPGFYCITEENGIYLWQYHHKQQIYMSNKVSSITGIKLGKGNMNSEGIYIIGGSEDKDIKILNLTLSNEQALPSPLLKTFSHTEKVPSCFLLKISVGVCIDYKGQAKKYDLQTLQYIPPIFYDWETTPDASSKSRPKFHSGLISIRNVLTLGTSDGLLYLIDTEGNEIHVQNYTNTNPVVYEIGEVREDFLITVNGQSGCYLHKILPPTSPTSTLINVIEVSDYDYRSITTLYEEGYFAIGGGVSTGVDKSYGGFIYIYYIGRGSLVPERMRHWEAIPNNGCLIYAVKEVKEGVILAGGNAHCTQICLWNYAALPHILPLCWGVVIQGIYDFVPLPLDSS